MKINLLIAVVACFIATTVSIKSYSEDVVLDFSKSSGEIGFHAVGNPSALRINGTSKADSETLRGNLTITKGSASGVISFSLDSLKTGMSLRDKHMKNKYLETSLHPQATLQILKVDLPPGFLKDTAFDGKGLSFSGKFKVHGEEKDVVGTVGLKRSGDKIKIKPSFKIKISEYKIKIPSFMGITVAEDVTIYSDIETNVLVTKQ